VTTTLEVLFVCVHNAGRSQMAAALLDHHAMGGFRSAPPGPLPPRRSTPRSAPQWPNSDSTYPGSTPSH
jgi:hypothetical protein